MSKNILVLSGSPRKGGTTDKLVAAFTEGAESAGKSVTVYRTADLSISGCRGCNYCFKNNNECILQDDMNAVLGAFCKADAVVFAPPVYYFTVSAQLKLAIDRTYCIPDDKTTIKKAALLLTCGDDTNTSAEGAIIMHKHMAEWRKWEDVGVIVVTDLHEITDIDGRKELDDARKMGQEI
jgi:multimeric flavodoxin WrbA